MPGTYTYECCFISMPGTYTYECCFISIPGTYTYECCFISMPNWYNKHFRKQWGPASLFTGSLTYPRTAVLQVYILPFLHFETLSRIKPCNVSDSTPSVPRSQTEQTSTSGCLFGDITTDFKNARTVRRR